MRTNEAEGIRKGMAGYQLRSTTPIKFPHTPFLAYWELEITLRRDFPTLLRYGLAAGSRILVPCPWRHNVVCSTRFLFGRLAKSYPKSLLEAPPTSQSFSDELRSLTDRIFGFLAKKSHRYSTSDPLFSVGERGLRSIGCCHPSPISSHDQRPPGW